MISIIYFTNLRKLLKKYGEVRVLHPLNPKYDDIEFSKDIEYRIVGVVLEKKKRYIDKNLYLRNKPKSTHEKYIVTKGGIKKNVPSDINNYTNYR